MFRQGGKRPLSQSGKEQLSNRPFKRPKKAPSFVINLLDESSADSSSDAEPLQYIQSKFVFHLNQTGVIRGYNRYQDFLSRERIEGGHCQGFSAVWLQKAVEGKHQWFNDVWQKLLNFQFKASFEEDIDVEKFMALVIATQETLDNGHSYLIQPDPYAGAASSQFGMYLTDQFQQSRPSVFKSKYTLDDLRNMLKVRRNTIQYLFTGNEHCVAMLMVKGRYVVFDPNYKDVKYKVFANIDHAVAEIKYCLFDDFKEVAPSKLKLEVYQFRSQKACVDLPIDRISRFEPRDYQKPKQSSSVRLPQSVSFLKFTPQSQPQLEAEIISDAYDPKDGLNECPIL